MLSPNVSVLSTTGTTEGDTVTLLCGDGLFPVIPVTITCNSAGVWIPDPAELVCSAMTGISCLINNYYVFQCIMMLCMCLISTGGSSTSYHSTKLLQP